MPHRLSAIYDMDIKVKYSPFCSLCRRLPTRATSAPHGVGAWARRSDSERASPPRTKKMWAPLHFLLDIRKGMV
jgi:hypothetical protein